MRIHRHVSACVPASIYNGHAYFILLCYNDLSVLWVLSGFTYYATHDQMSGQQHVSPYDIFITRIMTHNGVNLSIDV